MSAVPDIVHALQPFAPAGVGPVRLLTASAGVCGDAGLRFRYRLEGDLGALRIPALRTPRRAGELWQHTCFEAFVAGPGGGYVELNFSPSREWAVYGFAGYRTGMTAVTRPEPRIAVTRSQGDLAVDAGVGAAVLPGAWRGPGTPLRVALSAVIEDGSGGISYWAVRHAPHKPDFHHADGFCIEVTIP